MTETCIPDEIRTEREISRTLTPAANHPQLFDKHYCFGVLPLTQDADDHSVALSASAWPCRVPSPDGVTPQGHSRLDRAVFQAVTRLCRRRRPPGWPGPACPANKASAGASVRAWRTDSTACRGLGLCHPPPQRANRVPRHSRRKLTVREFSFFSFFSLSFTLPPALLAVRVRRPFPPLSPRGSHDFWSER